MGVFGGSELLLLLLLWNLHKVLSSVVGNVELTPICSTLAFILGWEIDANARYYKWGWVLRHNNVELILVSVIFHCVGCSTNEAFSYHLLDADLQKKLQNTNCCYYKIKRNKNIELSARGNVGRTPWLPNWLPTFKYWVTFWQSSQSWDKCWWIGKVLRILENSI